MAKIKIDGVTVDVPGFTQAQLKELNTEIKYMNNYIKRQAKSGALFKGPVESRRGWGIGRSFVADTEQENAGERSRGSGLNFFAKQVETKVDGKRKAFTQYRTVNDIIKEKVKEAKASGSSIDVQFIAETTATIYKEQVQEFHQQYGKIKNVKDIKRATERATKRHQKNVAKAVGRAVGKGEVNFTKSEWGMYKEIQQKFPTLSSNQIFELMYQVSRSSKSIEQIFAETGHPLSSSDTKFIENIAISAERKI